MMARPCPLCSSVQLETLEELRYELATSSSLPRITELQLCLSCGFAFVNSNASESDYLTHYQVDSIYADQHRSGSGAGERDRQRLSKAASRLLPWIKRGDTFIDIGASTGGMLAAARSLLGVEPLGIDPDQRCVDAMREAGFEARKGTFAELPDDLNGSAGVVCLSHVLEHLWDPVRAIRLALKLLKPDGFVYVETPNSAGYASHPNVWRYYTDPEHINHFQLRDYATLAHEIGCDVVDSGTDSLLLEDGTPYPVAWTVLRMSKRPMTVEVSNLPVVRPHPIEQYLDHQRDVLEEWQAMLEQVRRAGMAPMLVWGTGSHAARILGAGLIQAHEVAAFIDSDSGKQGKRLLDRAILAPATAFAAFPDSVVAVLAARAAAHAIAQTLIELWPGKDVVYLS